MKEESEITYSAEIKKGDMKIKIDGKDAKEIEDLANKILETDKSSKIGFAIIQEVE